MATKTTEEKEEMPKKKAREETRGAIINEGGRWCLILLGKRKCKSGSKKSSRERKMTPWFRTVKHRGSKVCPCYQRRGQGGKVSLGVSPK